jgi:hypothetical protein
VIESPLRILKIAVADLATHVVILAFTLVEILLALAVVVAVAVIVIIGIETSKAARDVGIRTNVKLACAEVTRPTGSGLIDIESAKMEELGLIDVLTQGFTLTSVTYKIEWEKIRDGKCRFRYTATDGTNTNTTEWLDLDRCGG